MRLRGRLVVVFGNRGFFDHIAVKVGEHDVCRNTDKGEED